MDTNFDYQQAKNMDFVFETKPDVLAVVGLLGIAGYLIAEVFQYIFYAHGVMHVDPPVVTIVFGALLVAVSTAVEVFPDSA